MKNHQKGMSLVGAVLYLAIGLLCLIATIKILPVYLEAYSIQSTLRTMQSEPTTRDKIAMAPNKLMAAKEILGRYFQLNSINDVSVDNLQLHIIPNGLQWQFPYERRVHFIGNIDLVFTFDHSVVIDRE